MRAKAASLSPAVSEGQKLAGMCHQSGAVQSHDPAAAGGQGK